MTWVSRQHRNIDVTAIGLSRRSSRRRRHGDRTSPSLATATTATQRARARGKGARPSAHIRGPSPHRPVRRPRDSCPTRSLLLSPSPTASTRRYPRGTHPPIQASVSRSLPPPHHDPFQNNKQNRSRLARPRRQRRVEEKGKVAARRPPLIGR